MRLLELRHSGTRFIVVGGISTVVHVLIVALLVDVLGMGASRANGVAFLTASLTSYVLNTRWSFSSSWTGGNLVRFSSVAAVGCLMSMAIAGAVATAGFGYEVGIAAVIVVVTPTTYALHRGWTYGGRQTPRAAEH